MYEGSSPGTGLGLYKYTLFSKKAVLFMFFAYLSVHKCYNFNKLIFFFYRSLTGLFFLKNKVNFVFRKQNQHERSPSNSFCSQSIVTELQRGERNLDFFRQALDEELCYCQKTVATKR